VKKLYFAAWRWISMRIVRAALPVDASPSTGMAMLWIAVDRLGSDG